MSCEGVRKQLALMLYDELSFEEEDLVQRHLETCEACRMELSRAKKLHAELDSAELSLSPQLLQSCRRNLCASLSVAPQSRWSWFPDWPMKPIGAVALVLAGFAGGILFRPPDKVEAAAYHVRSIEPSSSGGVRLVVDETRQRVLSGELGDQHIRDLLLSAARDSNDPGIRVETVDLLKSQSQSADVRGTLIAALQNDANAGVRLKALEGLSQWASEPDTRKALAQVVMSDTNPGVRTQAIDLLIQKPEPAIVGVLQELLATEENNYVRLKCQRVLHEMNASAETF